MSEHEEQAVFMTTVRYWEAQIPELKWLHAIPNGGARNAVTGARMKAEGVRKGIWDVHFPCPRGPYNGLWIEFKYGKNKLSPDQEAFGEFVRAQGYQTGVAYSAEEGIRILEEYLNA